MNRNIFFDNVRTRVPLESVVCTLEKGHMGEICLVGKWGKSSSYSTPIERNYRHIFIITVGKRAD